MRGLIQGGDVNEGRNLLLVPRFEGLRRIGLQRGKMSAPSIETKSEVRRLKEGIRCHSGYDRPSHRRHYIVHADHCGR